MLDDGTYGNFYRDVPSKEPDLLVIRLMSDLLNHGADVNHADKL